MKRALITGITGQDGSYLAEYLLAEGYTVYGLVRRVSQPNFGNISHILDKVTLIYGDLLDESSLFSALIISQPDEVYHLASQSFVGDSWKYPIATADQTGLGTLRLLEAIRQYNKKIRFYQASTSEMFGNEPGPQSETTALNPRSPYAISKLFAHHITKNYRESYGMFACSGILFNHESPRRGLQFVTRKITDGVARIKAGKQETLHLGNLSARRDYGFAGDYVIAMHKMLQLDFPIDLVVGSGESHSIQEVVDLAFSAAGLDPTKHVVIDPAFFRPAEVNELVADFSLAQQLLAWSPTTSFSELIHMMLEHDLGLQLPGTASQKSVDSITIISHDKPHHFSISSRS